MDNKTLSRVSGKQTLLTRRLDLSCGLIKKENEQKNTVQVSIENGARPDWSEARINHAEQVPLSFVLIIRKGKTRYTYQGNVFLTDKLLLVEEGTTLCKELSFTQLSYLLKLEFVYYFSFKFF